MTVLSDRWIAESQLQAFPPHHRYKFLDTFFCDQGFVGENMETMQTKVPRANIKFEGN